MTGETHWLPARAQPAQELDGSGWGPQPQLGQASSSKPGGQHQVKLLLMEPVSPQNEPHMEPYGHLECQPPTAQRRAQHPLQPPVLQQQHSGWHPPPQPQPPPHPPGLLGAQALGPRLTRSRSLSELPAEQQQLLLSQQAQQTAVLEAQRAEQAQWCVAVQQLLTRRDSAGPQQPTATPGLGQGQGHGGRDCLPPQQRGEWEAQRRAWQAQRRQQHLAWEVQEGALVWDWQHRQPHSAAAQQQGLSPTPPMQQVAVSMELAWPGIRGMVSPYADAPKSCTGLPQQPCQQPANRHASQPASTAAPTSTSTPLAPAACEVIEVQLPTPFRDAATGPPAASRSPGGDAAGSGGSDAATTTTAAAAGAAVGAALAVAEADAGGECSEVAEEQELLQLLGCGAEEQNQETGKQEGQERQQRRGAREEGEEDSGQEVQGPLACSNPHMAGTPDQHQPPVQPEQLMYGAPSPQAQLSLRMTASAFSLPLSAAPSAAHSLPPAPTPSPGLLLQQQPLQLGPLPLPHRHLLLTSTASQAAVATHFGPCQTLTPWQQLEPPVGQPPLQPPQQQVPPLQGQVLLCQQVDCLWDVPQPLRPPPPLPPSTGPSGGLYTAALAWPQYQQQGQYEQYQHQHYRRTAAVQLAERRPWLQPELPAGGDQPPRRWSADDAYAWQTSFAQPPLYQQPPCPGPPAS